VLSASHHLEDLFDGTFPRDKILSEALGMVRQIAIPKMALDATLLAGTLEGRYFRTFQTGDGVIVCRMRDGSLRYYQTRFGANMPYYLSYGLDTDRQLAYLEAAKTVTLTTNRFEPGVGWGTPAERVENLDEFRSCQTHIFGRDEVETVLLLSDGAESFMRKGTTESIPLEAVIEQVSAFKNYGGDFITRRLNAFLERYCVQEGWVHNDDFSCAGIYAEPIPEGQL
jgi:hypothetical protein